MTSDNPFGSGTIEYWKEEARRLYGFSIRGNLSEIAEALMKIDNFLKFGQAFEILVTKKEGGDNAD